MMRSVYADLHIHIGSAQEKRVKITASPRLRLQHIFCQQAPQKGLNLVGIVDSGSDPVFAELEEMVAAGLLAEHPQGGLRASSGVAVILAVEVESREGVHIIIYLPYMSSVQKYRQYIRSRIKNTRLSCPRSQAGLQELLNLSYLLEGIFCPAHAFTPHKGIYGVWTDRLEQALGRSFKSIKVLELGLCADTDMADLLAEPRQMTFLSNSDAHSLQNIAREYNRLRMKELSFAELKKALENQDGRRVLANYGLDPRLHKYYRSYCRRCRFTATDAEPMFICPVCGGEAVVGVWDHLMSIRDYDQPHHPVGRPDYHYCVPLSMLPGMGPDKLHKLLQQFGNEITAAETASLDQLAALLGEELAGYIQDMRQGRLPVPGGGGQGY